MREEVSAAIFDFDWILFHPGAGWKVTNPEIDVLGRSIPWQHACMFFEAILKQNPGAEITDHFLPNEYTLTTTRIEDHASVTPYSSLLKTALSHKRRGHKLYVISQKNYPGLIKISEIFMSKHKGLPLSENPLLEAGVLFADASRTGGDPLFARLLLLRSMLNRKGVIKDESYDQIFYYFTQPGFERQIKEFLDVEEESLNRGRMSVIGSFITDIT